MPALVFRTAARSVQARHDRTCNVFSPHHHRPSILTNGIKYSYLAAVPLFVVYSVAMTVIKFKEGFLLTPDRRSTRSLLIVLLAALTTPLVVPMPYDMYTRRNRDWILPLNFVFSFAWALEL